MSIIGGAKKTAFLRHLSATGEEILIDGRAVKAAVGNEESTPDIGDGGEPILGVTLNILIAADAVAPEALSHGVPLHIRGGEYGLFSKEDRGPYYDVTLYKR